MIARVLFLLAIGAAAGCASRVMQAEPPPSSEPAVEDLDAALERALPAGAAADCDRAGQLRETICELSRRICATSERAPLDRDLAEKCADGKLRCERARARVDRSCVPGAVDSKR
jgi:hypothetical protein